MGPIEWIRDAFTDDGVIEPRVRIPAGSGIMAYEARMPEGLWNAYRTYIECRRGLETDIPASATTLAEVLVDDDASAAAMGAMLVMLSGHREMAVEGGLQGPAIDGIIAALLARLGGDLSGKAKVGITVPDVDLVVIDIDEALTDGRIIRTVGGLHLQSMSLRDAKGVAMMGDAGISVVLMSRYEVFPDMVEMASARPAVVHRNVLDKASRTAEIARGLDVPPERIAFMGGDVDDIGVVIDRDRVFAPADAIEDFIAEAGHVMRKASGDGAVREMAKMLLAVRGTRSGGDDEGRGYEEKGDPDADASTLRDPGLDS